MTSTSSPSRSDNPNWYPPWSPRFWSGMGAGDTFRLLRENRFQIHPARYPMAALVSGCGLLNSTLSAVQQVVYRRRIREAELMAPPIFIVGHWRSGTTLMHELVAMDDRFAFPSNFDAFIPRHVLVSRFALYPLVKLLMPSRRPMDDMSMSIDSPQEDDFALCALGAPTPYRRIAFPNRPHRDHLDLNLDQASPATRQALHAAMDQFLKTLTIRYGKRLVLKSPPHTGRIRQLAEWFPGAKFVHLARHPHKLVPSTMRLWSLLDQIQGFQIPNYDETWLKNYIFECQELMYSGYLEQRQVLDRNQLVEVRFEDLVARPVEEMNRVYETLELDQFDVIAPRIESYFDRKKNHRTNRLQIDTALKSEIDSQWQGYMDEFGYARDSDRPVENFRSGSSVVDAVD